MRKEWTLLQGSSTYDTFVPEFDRRAQARVGAIPIGVSLALTTLGADGDRMTVLDSFV